MTKNAVPVLDAAPVKGRLVELPMPAFGVPVADGVLPLGEVDVALPLTKTPPVTAGGTVLTLVLAARALYASSVFGDGGGLFIVSDSRFQRTLRIAE